MREPIALTRRLCAAPAPYVGEPFVYLWYTATDDYGRAVAGDCWIEYGSLEFQRVTSHR